MKKIKLKLIDIYIIWIDLKLSTFSWELTLQILIVLSFNMMKAEIFDKYYIFIKDLLFDFSRAIKLLWL